MKDELFTLNETVKQFGRAASAVQAVSPTVLQDIENEAICLASTYNELLAAYPDHLVAVPYWYARAYLLKARHKRFIESAASLVEPALPALPA